MKHLIPVLLCLTACGKYTGSVPTVEPSPAPPCQTSSVATGYLLSCPGQTPVTISNGVNGINGLPGVNGVSPSVVQLCPGTSNYGTFVEFAILVGSKLYAVYSDHGGFLTYLAPGNYSSNGIGSACSFTVHNDNSISH
jgi:hypothetical protein